MKRRADQISDAVIRERRTVRLPSGATGPIVGMLHGQNEAWVALVVDGRHEWCGPMPVDAVIEIGGAA